MSIRAFDEESTSTLATKSCHKCKQDINNILKKMHLKYLVDNKIYHNDVCVCCTKI